MHSTVSGQALARKHLDRRLAGLRGKDDFVRPPRGWVRAIREAIGMTAAQLGKRIGVSQSRVARMEKGEVDGSITLKTLRHVAEGLNCTIVYALVPNKALDEWMRDRARQIADRQLARTDHTMKLENQALEPRELKVERERLVEALIAGDPRRLWDVS